jgi:hypothetical protein
MARWRDRAGLMLVGLLWACGGEEEEPSPFQGQEIDCAWFQGDNCYKQALASVRACVESGSGTLAADGTRCTYASGLTVTFNQPVHLPVSDEHVWDFEIATGANRCVGYHELDKGLRLDTPRGTFVEEMVGLGVQLTCPDGSKFYLRNAFDSFQCGLEHLPGNTHSWSSSTVSFSLIGGGPSSSVHLFTCQST